MEVIKAHESVSGMTQGGKTYYALEKCRRFDGGVLFFNPQYVTTGFGQVNGKYDIEYIVGLLKDGQKLDYRPQINNDTAKAELKYLTDKILAYHVKGTLDNTLFAVDEAHVYCRHNDNNPAEGIATRGKGKGLYGLFITQRPALMSKTLYSLSEVKTYFDCEDEDLQYFRGQGLDTDKVFNAVRGAGKYHYVQKYQNELSEPQKV